MSESPFNTAFIRDPAIIQSVTAGLETVINQALRYDPASRQAVAALTDILAVEMTAPALTIYIRGQDNGVAILSYTEAPVVAHLKGSPIGLLQLAKGSDSLANSEVHLAGNPGLLQQWQKILHNLEIDWEDAISELLGDILGPRVANSIRSSASWAQQQAIEQQRLIPEYLTEELNITPSRAEAEHLFSEINTLTMNTDRLSARLRKIQRALATNERPKG